MKFNSKKLVLVSLSVIFIFLFSSSIIAKEKQPYKFKVKTEVKRTPVKDQSRTGTCWCFATISFLESEYLRLENSDKDINLSEMYVVRNTYPHKADNYVKLHGKANFGQGGQSHDVINQIKRYGIVPEKVYNGMNIGKDYHDHSEMGRVLKGMLEGLLNKRWRDTLTLNWKEAFESVLDVYLGKVPSPSEEFEYNGKKYTPKSFVTDYLGLNMDNYIELTSFSAYPYYEQCRLEVPDNWTYNDEYYNIPIDVIEKIVDEAVKNGYSVAWDGDVSEEFFSSRKAGIAIVPEDDKLKLEDIKKPVKEKKITQEMREKTFLNFSTTDDHLMHIVGIAFDQNGTKFYLTKNSGGTDRKYEGYVYISSPYLRLKTIAIMVNKDSLPSNIKNKLGL